MGISNWSILYVSRPINAASIQTTSASLCWFCSRSLYRVDVANVASVSEIHAASIFKVEVSGVGECFREYIAFCASEQRGKCGGGCLVRVRGGGEWGKLSKTALV
jgi:hypothetical protein